MKRTRGRRKRNSVDHGLIITSMVDMFTLVLLFLLVFYDPDYQADTTIELPNAASQRPAESGTTVRVFPGGIEVGGALVVGLRAGALDVAVPRDGTAVVPVVAALSRAREALAATADGEPPVLIVECDKRVSWTVLGAVLESGARAGFPRYRFLVLSDE